MKRLFSIMLAFVLLAFTLLTIITTGYGEHELWDCPDCGRKENKGNYCGECGYPAPWTDPEVWKDDAAEREAKLAAFRNVGGYVTFGSYEQDNNTANGQEPIEWLVLDYDAIKNRALLLSRYGLDAQPYNTKLTSIIWGKCTLRTWLNGTFLKMAFTAQEQAGIELTNVDNSNSQHFGGWGPSDGKSTLDRVFLLSYAEANKYLGVTYYYSSNTTSRVAPTAYALKQGAGTHIDYKTVDGIAAGWWWLRSPGLTHMHAADVNTDGSLNCYSVSSDAAVVRPAVWINLASDIF